MLVNNSGEGPLYPSCSHSGTALAAGRDDTVLHGLHKLIWIFARCLGYADLPFEVVHHAFMQTNFGGLLGDGHFVDLVLQAQQAIEKILRPRRAAYDVHVHGHDAVHSLEHGIGIERATDRRTSAHRDAPLGIGHLVIDAIYHRSHFQRNRSGHNHEVALARAGAKHLRPEARDVETRSGSGDHLDRTAGQAECHGPNRRLARPVENVIDRGDQKILLEPVVNPSHECLLSISAPHLQVVVPTEPATAGEWRDLLFSTYYLPIFADGCTPKL